MDYDLDRNNRKIAEVLVRKVPDDQQVRVCPVDSGLIQQLCSHTNNFKLGVSCLDVKSKTYNLDVFFWHLIVKQL